MRNLYYLTLLFTITVNGLFAEDTPDIPENLKRAVLSIPDKGKAERLSRAVKIVTTAKTGWSEERQRATKDLIDSGNVELAICAVDEWGWWLSCLDIDKKWKASDAEFLARAIVKMALPDDPVPGGEELAVRKGAVAQLSVLLSKALNQPAPERSALLSDAKLSHVKAWVIKMLNNHVQQADAAPQSRSAIQAAIPSVEKETSLPVP